jgi:hypothetical protein
MLTRGQLWTTRAKLAAATITAAMLASLTLLLALSAHPAAAQVSLLPKDQIGAQAQPDLAFSSRTPTKVFHVAQTGSDSNPGTSAQPWRTIRKAAGTLQAGQAVYVHTGTYYERVDTTNSGTSSAPIWLMEAPGENVVIKGTGSSGSPFIRITRPYWIIDGFEIDAGDSQNHAIRVQTDSAQGFNANHIVVRNVKVHNGTGPAAVVLQGAADAALLNSEVYDYKFGDNDSHGVLITGTSRRVLIQGNHSWATDGDGVQCQPTSGLTPPTDITIDGNRLHEHRENALDIKTCNSVTIRANKMFGYRPSPVPCPGNCSPNGDALVIHENASRVLIERNRIWNSSRGASIGASNGTLGPIVFRRNLLFDLATGTGLSTSTVGSGNGVRISYTPDAEIYHNTFYNLRGTAIAVGDNGGSVTRADVINNIVQKAGMGFSKGSVSSLTVQKNLFWETPQGVPTGSIVNDPMFVADPRNYDFYTKPGSPARDVALHEPRFVDAANYEYCHAGPDIGFLESCT